MPSIMYTGNKVSELKALVPNTSQNHFQYLKSMNVDIILNYLSRGVGIEEIDPVLDSSWSSLLWNQALIEHEEYMDLCYQNRLKSFVNINDICRKLATINPSRMFYWVDLIVRRWKDHPAVYGFYTFDEPLESVFPKTIRRQVYSLIKSLTDKPVLEVFMMPNFEAGQFDDNTCDIIGFDIYLFKQSNNDTQQRTELTNFLNGANSYINAINPNKPRLYVGQAHQDDLSYFRMPTDNIGLQQQWQVCKERGWDNYGHCLYMWDRTLAGGSYEGNYLIDFPQLHDDVTAVFAQISEDLYPITSIVISPQNISLQPNQQIQFTAKAYDSQGNEVYFTPQWSVVKIS